ncbi:hypothetical protein PMAYCL1PPCAC_05663, partial [Pristionchus mayeri]
MSWVPLYIPDFVLAPSFCYFLGVLTLTKDASLRTPFYSLFIVTGICGLSTVVTHILMNRVTWPASFDWIRDIFLVINQSSMLGALFGKFCIALHRYLVLRQVALNEKIWPTRIVQVLIAIQLIIPFMITGVCFSLGYVVQTIANGTISYNVAAQGQIIQKFISNGLTGVYVIVSIVLTYLSSRKLDDLRKRLQGQSKSAILRQQKNMFIVVAVCSLSHILKAGQQSLIVIYSLNGTINRSVYETLLWPTFVATNGLATYAPPLILIFCSSRIRSLLFGQCSAKVRQQASTEFTVNIVPRSR